MPPLCSGQVTVNRGYSCGEYASLSNGLYDKATGQRKDQFSDLQVSANASAMEQFWCVAKSDENHTNRATFSTSISLGFAP